MDFHILITDQSFGEDIDSDLGSGPLSGYTFTTRKPISNTLFKPMQIPQSHCNYTEMDHQQQFMIEASEVSSMVNKTNFPILQLLPSFLTSIKPLARVPISNFKIAAVGLGSSGKIFFGVNLEFPGLPLHQSVHAEQFMINNAFINGESHIRYVAVTAAPCGHCRQFFQEIRKGSEIKILITSADDLDYKPISDFLPGHFGPSDLLEESVPLLLDPRHNGLVLLNDSDNDGDELKRSALEAANRSYAPYSKCPSGIALMDSDGKVYKGSYLESAAYNPSLGPMQAALIAYVAGGGGSYDKIVAGVLVEKEGVVVRQEAVAGLLLTSVSPSCKFSVFHCK